jgi:hypothetical protein
VSRHMPRPPHRPACAAPRRGIHVKTGRALVSLLLLTGGRSGPRASRPSRAVLIGSAKRRLSPHSARRVPRLCAPLPLVAVPENAWHSRQPRALARGHAAAKDARHGKDAASLTHVLSRRPRPFRARVFLLSRLFTESASANLPPDGSFPRTRRGPAGSSAAPVRRGHAARRAAHHRKRAARPRHAALGFKRKTASCGANARPSARHERCSLHRSWHALGTPTLAHGRCSLPRAAPVHS